jgi:hypothetical protein
MAIFHLSSQIVKRSKGRSSVACASYRCGVDLYDERVGRTHSFTREDRVVDGGIIAPDFATAEWARDRSQLWNSLEAIEKRSDAQLCQELECALPHELPNRQHKKLIEAFIDENFTKKGFIADWNKHVAPIGSPNYNDHVHIMRPLRAIDAETGGWRKTKDRAASKEQFADARGDEIEELRASWAKHVNKALEDAGIPEEECQRVDHRSNKRRGIEALPTVHEGRPAREMEARGERSDRITYNREIRQINLRILEEIKARAIQAGNAVKRAAAAIGLGFTPATQAQAPKKPEPAPAPALQPPQMRPDKVPIGLAQTTGLELTPWGTSPAAPKKEKPAPPPIEPKPQPAKPIENLALKVIDEVAEKKKKDGHRDAWFHRGGGGGVGG